MKRILAIMLAALMLCCAFVACDNGDDPAEETTNAAKTEAPTTEEPTTEEPTTEEETTDDGLPDMVTSYIDVWDEDKGDHNATKIDEKHKGMGVAITVPEGGYLYEAAVQAPSYSDNIGNLTIKIFVWNTDYATTVAAEPVFAQEFVDFADNSTLICEFEEGQISAGRYLIVACDGVDEGEGVGVWTGRPYNSAKMPEEYVKYNIESWVNGKLNKKVVAKFSLVIEELEVE